MRTLSPWRAGTARARRVCGTDSQGVKLYVRVFGQVMLAVHPRARRTPRHRPAARDRPKGARSMIPRAPTRKPVGWHLPAHTARSTLSCDEADACPGQESSPRHGATVGETKHHTPRADSTTPYPGPIAMPRRHGAGHSGTLGNQPLPSRPSFCFTVGWRSVRRQAATGHRH